VVTFFEQQFNSAGLVPGCVEESGGDNVLRLARDVHHLLDLFLLVRIVRGIDDLGNH
jgi:hypothetical protein